MCIDATLVCITPQAVVDISTNGSVAVCISPMGTQLQRRLAIANVYPLNLRKKCLITTDLHDDGHHGRILSYPPFPTPQANPHGPPSSNNAHTTLQTCRVVRVLISSPCGSSRKDASIMNSSKFIQNHHVTNHHP